MSSISNTYKGASAKTNAMRAKADDDLKTRTAQREDANARLLGEAQPVLKCLEELRKLDQRGTVGMLPEYPGLDYILQIKEATRDEPPSYYSIAIKYGMKSPFVGGYGTLMQAHVVKNGRAVPFLEHPRAGWYHSKVPAMLVILRDDGFLVRDFPKYSEGYYPLHSVSDDVTGLTARQFLGFLAKWLGKNAPNRPEFLPILERAEAALPPDPEPAPAQKPRRKFLGFSFGK